MNKPAISAPSIGSRVLCRDAEWMVKSVDPSNDSHDHFAVTCKGTDPLVRGHEAVFLTQLDEIIPIDPKQTELVADTTSGFQLSKLFLEAQLRQMPVTGSIPTFDLVDETQKLKRGVFDPMPFQQATVRKALKQLRPRLLLADAVGLGKTIQVGMVLSELAARGRADRVLVLAKKSMLTQFQAELWNRFGFPLVRLDSDTIARLRLQIPASKNPFDVYHRVIVSIDTLKNVGNYRSFLENANWDCVVIDEAHNVAGASVPSRHLAYRLARLLARKSEAMLLTTATPHNGKRDTFGRLITLLDPAAIPDPDLREYTADDIKDFFLMRLKEDVREDAGGSLPERLLVPIDETTVDAKADERDVFATFAAMRSLAKEEKRSGERLLQYGLYKQFLSSPESCLQTVRKRMKQATPDGDDDTAHALLVKLERQLTKMTLAASSRFEMLVEQLQQIGWTGSPDCPRLLIFTEYRATQDALAAAIAKKFKHKWTDSHDSQAGGVIATIHGGMSDVNLMDCVERFSTGNAEMRMLIATDVASEGINLHHHCHHIIHFDLPWSIITLVQRNGRIDRFGQTENPVLRYLRVRSHEADFKGDETIFEKLVTKVEEINRSTRQGETVLKLYDEDAEQRYIAERGILAGNEAVLESPADEADPEAAALEELLGLIGSGNNVVDLAKDPTAETPTSKGSLARSTTTALAAPRMSDLDYFTRSYEYLAAANEQYPSLQRSGHLTLLTPPDDLKRYLGQSRRRGDVLLGASAIPGESWPADDLIRITDDVDKVNLAIKAARNTSGYWSKEWLCAAGHPLMNWITEQMVTVMNRGQCPHLTSGKLARGEFAFCFIGAVSSDAGRPLVSDAHAVCFLTGGDVQTRPLGETLDRAGLDGLTNDGAETKSAAAKLLLHSAVEQSIEHLQQLGRKAIASLAEPIRAEQRRLRSWSSRRKEFLNQKIESLGETHPRTSTRRRNRRNRKIFGLANERMVDSELRQHRRTVDGTGFGH